MVGLPTQTNFRRIGLLSLFKGFSRIYRKVTRGQMWGLEKEQDHVAWITKRYQILAVT